MPSGGQLLQANEVCESGVHEGDAVRFRAWGASETFEVVLPDAVRIELRFRAPAAAPGRIIASFGRRLARSQGESIQGWVVISPLPG